MTMKMKLKIYSLVTAFVIGSLAPLSAAVVFPYRSSWKYSIGTQEASNPIEAWRARGFNDASWTSSDAPLGYPSSDAAGLEASIQTLLPTSAVGGYTSVFLRKTFVVVNPAGVARLNVSLQYDDGYVLWINGTEIGRSANIAAGPVTFATVATPDHEVSVSEDAYSLSNNLASLLVAGTNVVAIQVFNAATTSSDLFIDAAVTSDVDDQPPMVIALEPAAGATVLQL